MAIAHVTIHTARFEESVAFYRDIVGLTEEQRLPGGRRIVFLTTAPEETAIELIEEEAPSPVGDGISVGFNVEDVAAKRRFCLKKGVDATEIFSPGPNVAFFFVKDPNGVTIQFI
ncbi:MAG: VOC family protein [Bacillota bacterium]|jgi:lactoylglutathione lyase